MRQNRKEYINVRLNREGTKKYNDYSAELSANIRE